MTNCILIFQEYTQVQRNLGPWGFQRDGGQGREIIIDTEQSFVLCKTFICRPIILCDSSGRCYYCEQLTYKGSKEQTSG